MMGSLFSHERSRKVEKALATEASLHQHDHSSKTPMKTPHHYHESLSTHRKSLPASLSPNDGVEKATQEDYAPKLNDLIALDRITDQIATYYLTSLSPSSSTNVSSKGCSRGMVE